MKTIEQIARELGDDWDTTLPEDKVFIENVAKAYLSAWLEQQSQEPVAYMAPSGTCVTAEDVSYTPNWTDYYTLPLYAAPPPAKVEPSQEPVAWMGRDGEDFSYKESSYFTKPLFLAPPPAIPDHMCLVPKEPTEAMILAARQSHEEEAYLPYSVYKSMIEAAQGGKP